MIVSSAPLRVSFSGGGSDYRQHFGLHGGAIFGSAINKRVYVFVNPLSKFSNESVRFTYRITESVQNVDELQHPVVREVLKIFGVKNGINIATLSDLPGNTGLGSSSAFTVALIKALSTHTGKQMSADEIWRLGYKIEREILGESGGIQDHLHATFGGLRHYSFTGSELKYSEDLISETFRKLFKNRALLIRVGETRESEKAAAETALSIQNPAKLLEIMKSAEIATMGYENFLKSSSDDERFQVLSHAINQNWKSKVQFQNIANKTLDQKIKGLMDSGGVSFKLCGAGDSGFLLTLFESIKPETYLEKDVEVFELDSRGVESFEI